MGGGGDTTFIPVALADVVLSEAFVNAPGWPSLPCHATALAALGVLRVGQMIAEARA